MSDSIRRLAWATDLHLDFARDAARAAFYREVLAARPDALLAGGDISNGQALAGHLREMERELGIPIFFVLGNHDHYGSSFAVTEERVRAVVDSSRHLRWLPLPEVAELAPGTALVGHGGWADGRSGDYAGSNVPISDYMLIGDFLGLDRGARLRLLHALGDRAAAWAREALPRAFERCRRLLLLTHVPPFQEAAWHEGAMSHPHFLPHFSSRAMGEALLEAMRARPDRELLVLCGHTHGSGAIEPLPNLAVLTAGARYGKPALARIFDLDDPRLCRLPER